MKKIVMKTPISYYGGKQQMLKHILPVIPKHEVYCEPFFGGGAVFWGKEPVKAEIINDVNGMVSNFYVQLKTNFSELKRMIDATPYERNSYRRAMVVYDHPYIFESVVKAWAFWVATIQGYSNKVGTWRSSQPGCKESLSNDNKKLTFSEELSNRLQLVQIENVDAIRLISRMDTEGTFFYVDPPYVGSNQGHYGGYCQEHFNSLLSVLAAVKGRFLLSSYRNDELNKMVADRGWYYREVSMSLSASAGVGKRKIECLTANYAI